MPDLPVALLPAKLSEYFLNFRADSFLFILNLLSGFPDFVSGLTISNIVSSAI